MICVTEAGVDAPGSLVSMPAQASGVSGYEFSSAGESHVLVFSDSDQGWTLGPWSSDAKMLYCRRARDGALEHLALVQGSFVEHDNHEVLLAERRVTRCEAWREAAGWRISSPAGETVRITEHQEKAN